MSKRIIAVFMLASMLFSLAACNGAGLLPSKESTSETTSVTEEPSSSETTESEQEPTTEETTASEETTEEETTTSETTSETTTEAATPTPMPIGKTTVTNAYSRSFKVTGYGKFTTKYPKVTIEGVSTSEINNEIAKKFSPVAKKNDSVVKYSYYIGKKYVSILITVNLDAGMEGDEYYVYNVSRETGKKLSKNEMLELLGLSINSAVPFVNSKGKKCYLLRHMKAPGQCEYTDLYEKI